MFYKHIYLNLAAGVVIALLMNGCGSPKTNYYVLTPIEKGTAILERSEQGKALAVEISSFKLPAYLNRPQIVTHSGKNSLELDQFNQWGGKLDQNIARVMVKNLALLLDTSEVSMAPHRRLLNPDFRIEVDILKFERETNGIVYLSAKWRILDGNANHVLASNISEMNSQRVSLHGYNATVEAMSYLAGKLSEGVAEEIIRLTQQDA